MIHPPTFTHGPLQAHELDDPAGLLDDLDAFIATASDAVPEHLRIRVPVWAARVANVAGGRS
ncbi:MAG: hypothetical protein M0Z30_15750 [Actinomycetota bacterium]|nr:hypothetical protein [Actinomycetota bacterium]